MAINIPDEIQQVPLEVIGYACVLQVIDTDRERRMFTPWKSGYSPKEMLDKMSIMQEIKESNARIASEALASEKREFNNKIWLLVTGCIVIGVFVYVGHHVARYMDKQIEKIDQIGRVEKQ